MPKRHSTPLSAPPLMGANASAAPSTLLSAEQAARRLGVSKATLYAYVSRGRLTAVPDALDPRASRYSSFEISVLERRRGSGRRQLQQTLAAVNEGLPILETALSCAHAGRPVYRGQDAVDLARTATVEDVARLLWQCGPSDPFDAPPPELGEHWLRQTAELRKLALQPRTLALLALALPRLQGAWWLEEPQALAHAAGAHLRAAMACFLARAPQARPLHEQFAQAWRLGRRAHEPLRQALVLAADHEMNMVAFIGRALASVGSDMGSALLAAMCTLNANFVGGASVQVEQLWDDLATARDLNGALAARLDQGQGLPGFNHIAYPAGDPRAALLLRLCAQIAPQPPIARAVKQLTGWDPAIDFAFVALRRALGAPKGAALALQLGGRCVGVIAHVLEQRRSGQRIMTRARYVGPLP
jgi:citrate synthase